MSVNPTPATTQLPKLAAHPACRGLMEPPASHSASNPDPQLIPTILSPTHPTLPFHPTAPLEQLLGKQEVTELAAKSKDQQLRAEGLREIF